MVALSDARLALVWCLAILGSLALACLVVSFLWSPEAMAAGEPLASIGMSAEACPGCSLCGMSRAFGAASRLQLERAIAFNPGVLFAYPGAAALAVAGPSALVLELSRRSRTSRSCA